MITARELRTHYSPVMRTTRTERKQESMSAWKRYEVAVHGYGRKLVRRGPAEGLLDWPAHTWGKISTRPMGLAAAIALADAQPHHATVQIWMSAEKVHDNGKPPAVPEGWWPATAQTAAEPRPSDCR